ncbi:MAG TPA: glycoside hydrolase family 44 protein [Myxococcales bacterium]|nr:glycoside hydrolase family 44 protein [Myxococcales bacterium]
MLLVATIGAGPAVKPSPPAAAARLPVFESVIGLAPGFRDLGWAPRTLARGAPASFDFSGKAGWIAGHDELKSRFGELIFRIHQPASFGDFLDVRLDSSVTVFPRVPLSKGKQRTLADGWVEVTLPMTELNPGAAAFNAIVFQAAREVAHDRVLMDGVVLTAAAVQTRVVRMTVDCTASRHPISQLIYGTANGDNGWWELGTTARRWGGNPNSRYNWRIGNVWNTGNDYFFRNTDYGNQPGPAWLTWLQSDIDHHVASALTVPALGWVAKDNSSYSFPVSRFGAQQQQAHENQDMGNGVNQAGQPIKPAGPEMTSVPAPPEFVSEWVKTIAAKGLTREISMYIIDNEPTLWQDTHRDVHPNAVTYDELLDRTIRYASAVRAADPKATIAGFAGWGWTSLFFSAADLTGRVHSDRLTHGTTPLLPWWLRRVREQEQRTGVRLIDVLDVHWYPQGKDIYSGGNGATDPASAALRIRSVRSLWDPTYKDESWIDEEPKLIPRLKAWIEDNDPGLKISIGEYNFGGEKHMSGGLAQAEALGRFGNEGIYSAFYWTFPPVNSPSYWAFRAYRNFDGQGGRFLDESVKARALDPLASIFASRSSDGHQVLVLLNTSPEMAAKAQIDLLQCAAPGTVNAFVYTGGSEGFVSAPGASPGQQLVQDLPPYSMTVLDLRPKR